MKILTETVSPFSENTYFLVDPDSAETVVVDPGDEAPRLLEVIQEQGLDVKMIALTHGHLDHVGAAAALQRATQAPVAMHRGDEFLLDGLAAQAALFGISEPERPTIERFLQQGDVLCFGGDRIRLEVVETPGHSPGSVTFLVGQVVISGDVLFAGSIGRTDLPGGDYETLIRSIRQRLFSFPLETQVYPGHGPSTTIGREKRLNPFVSEGADI